MEPFLSILGSTYARELFYRNILIDAAHASSVKLPVLFPVGGAANYSLLALIFRACQELPVGRVLELGAGQSTLLLNAISTSRSQRLPITTVESDASWAEKIGKQVTHDVLLHALESRDFMGRTASCYSKPETLPTDIDLLIVDGPMGVRRFSRWSALEIASRSLAKEFLIIFDDAERIGEQDTIQTLLKQQFPKARFRVIPAKKSQFLVFTEKFSAAAFF
jgi:hypothetical protein